MMGLLAKGLSTLVGPWLSTLTLPALILGGIIMAHQLVQQRDARIEAEATNVCDKNWEAQVRRQERDAAAAEATAARVILEGERKVTEGLRDELDKLNQEIAAVRASSTGSDPRCLSDSVLRSLEGDGRGSAKGRSNRPK